MQSKQTNEVLRIKNLQVDFKLYNEVFHVVRDVNITVKKGKITALVGESGSGKSVTSLAVMDLLDRNACIKSGEIFVAGMDTRKVGKKERRKICTDHIGIIFQDPEDSLDPLYTVGNQLIESVRIHKKTSKKKSYKIAVELLQSMQFSNPEMIMRKYPFELSGGMCQRIMIAIAIIGQPHLLIADEPTTALDVTVQAYILKQIQKMSKDTDMGVLFITHDLGVVAEIANDIFIMKNGVIVESGTVEEIFHNPQQEYTKTLIQAI